MLLFYRTGARDYRLLQPALSDAEMGQLFLTARQVLLTRDYQIAAELLDCLPFKVYAATNYFNDEFDMLLAKVPLPQYESLRIKLDDKFFKDEIAQIARAITEMDHHIRLIAVELEPTKVGEWDAFICHASDDKEAIAKPIHSHLLKEGYRCWFDEGEILWGDSIIEKINEGLKESKYVIVILTKAFMKKNWPKKEFNAALTKEIETGSNRVLLLLAGDPKEHNEILEGLPIGSDKRYLSWTGDPEVVLRELRSLFAREAKKQKDY